jgi:hypothetical protein
MLASLLGSHDSVDRLAATWACYWFLDPTGLLPGSAPDPQLVNALIRCAEDVDSEPTIWKRAAACIGKINLGSSRPAGDQIYDWAVWLDKVLEPAAGQAPSPADHAYLAPPPLSPFHIPEHRLTHGLKRASELLGDAGCPRDLKRAAALLLAPYSKRGHEDEVGGALRDAAIDPLLVDDQQETFLVRLVQLERWHYVADLVKVAEEDMRVRAFLALAAFGKIHLLSDGDLQDEALSDLRDARHRLLEWAEGARPATAATPTAAA